jgi:hypothetical protein
VTVWWDEAKEQARLTDALRPHALALTTAVVDRTSRSLRPAKADGFSERIAARLLKVVAKRVKAVSDGTRDAVARAIRDGLDQGMSPAEVADSLDSLAVLANGSPAFDELRAETIARTEMAQTLNSASIASYDEFGVDKVEVIDGEGDDECAQANGEVWTLDQANENEIAHPNCTRTFSPYFGKAAPLPAVLPLTPQERLIEALTKLATREQVTHVYPTPITVDAPQITVNPPAVTVHPPPSASRRPTC